MIKPADVILITTKTNLVLRKDLHPAIQYLLLGPEWISTVALSTAHLFCRCSLFDRRFFGGLFALSIGFV
jgi:hypothetical protein